MKLGCSNIVALIQKELRHYFYSPIAYVVMMIFLTISGYFFHSGMARFSQQYTYYKSMSQMYGNPEILSRLNLNDMVIAPALFNMVFIFLFMLPLVMMRSFAEEKSRKTDELLKTSPLSAWQLIIGKFFGAFSFVVFMLLPTLAYQFLLFGLMTEQPPELGPIVTGYIGVLLFAAAGISVGLFASSLTENQIIGAVIAFVVLLFMFIINFINIPDTTMLGGMVKYLSVSEHLSNMLRGLIDTRDYVYFLSIAAVFLFLTKRSLETAGWR